MEFVRWIRGFQGYISCEGQHSLHHPIYPSIGRPLPLVVMSSHVDRLGQDFYSEIWHFSGFGFSMEKVTRSECQCINLRNCELSDTRLVDVSLPTH
jgi:hypothetical protein